MIVVHASFPLDPDRREESLELIGDLVEQSQAEDGVIDYRATIDAEDPNLVWFVERYEDEAAYEAHTQTDHYREFGEQIPDPAGRPEILRFDVDSVTEVEP